MASVERTSDKVWIPGAENEVWGCGGGPQNSVMAVLAVTMRLMGEPDYDFDYLMGVSGMAFRIQLYAKDEHGSCPSSPHTMVGCNCSTYAYDALPFVLDGFEPNKENPAESFAKVRERIDGGTPVMAYSEESDLILGYVPGKDRLLGRTYWHSEAGLSEIDSLPWYLLSPTHRRTPKSTKELVEKSLEVACENMETAQYGAYASGWAAFEEWRRRLAEHDWVESLPPEQVGAWLHTNGFIYWSLIEARTSAVAYLRRIAPQTTPKVAGYLLRAAELYDREVREVLRSPHEHQIAPMSWLRKEGEGWPREQRQLQVAKLRQAEECERRAIGELECALATM